MSANRSDRPTVVIASRLFTPEVSAGAFRLGALARGLAAGGAEVTVVTTTPPPHAPPVADPPGVGVSRWPVLRDRGGNVRGYIQYASFDAPLLFRLLFRRWTTAVAESPPTTGLVVALAAALRRRPFVYYAADVWTDGVIAMGAARPVIGLMRTMERAVLRRAAAVLSISDEVTERLVSLGADRGRIALVGNGIDTDVFSPDVPPAAADRYFVYTGTMSEWQRPDVFVRAFALIADEHPDLRLRFFGQGAVEADLRAIAEELVPGRVEFGGVVRPSESASWIRGATAALVSIAPGIGYDFARPTKTYAAAACGTPVLFAGAVTGGALVADAGLGEAAGFEPAAIAAAMTRLLDAAASGETERRRPARASWARDNVSLAAVGERAAQAVLGTGTGRR
ncbi:glycosyltransferase family 4 protein [Microbacterium gallinarum]|uniref:Glycosyltransferase family 4 protein n=1 Tax=Microbacterium gallinarum TaxID=2762209 RepID=A0ABR8WYV1_9MICO|nr:glycosyltransferase family 4 protein [Microbacterium gallinarum]MBD8022249.1 glycosyltransferase family 4 protein [Microbacterium gallinarum]